MLNIQNFHFMNINIKFYTKDNIHISNMCIQIFIELWRSLLFHRVYYYVNLGVYGLLCVLDCGGPPIKRMFMVEQT